MSFKPEDFSLDTMQRCFRDAVKDADNINVDLYLEGYEEIYKFLCLLGTVFGWVAEDVHEKVNAIKKYRNKPDVGEKFATVQSMIEYELTEAKTMKPTSKEDHTATRNHIRIHRAFEYIADFLENAEKLELAEKCCQASQDAYKRTLHKYHPWVVQKAAMFASHMLPTKEGLLWKICPVGDVARFEDTLKRLGETVQIMQVCYEAIEAVYVKHNLTKMP